MVREYCGATYGVIASNHGLPIMTYMHALVRLPVGKSSPTAKLLRSRVGVISRSRLVTATVPEGGCDRCVAYR